MAETERIIVTGSYIPTAETESPLPVTVYTADVLQKQGANTPAEGLRQLPSFLGNTATENDSNGGDGQAFVNLRALGAGNTLILINGRRAFGFTNVNAIPIGALARSEVLKDGASAIYGSDAVAGVVNFILVNGPGETPYQGAEINLLYGNTTDHDAQVLQGYIRGGVATDKVAIAAAAEYYDRESIYARDREISRLADQTNLGGFNNGSGIFAGRAAVIGRRPVVLSDPTNNAPTATSYRDFMPGTPPLSTSAPSRPPSPESRSITISSPETTKCSVTPCSFMGICSTPRPSRTMAPRPRLLLFRNRAIKIRLWEFLTDAMPTDESMARLIIRMRRNWPSSRTALSIPSGKTLSGYSIGWLKN